MRWRFPRDFSDADAGAPVDDAVREIVVTSVPFAPSASVAGWGVPGTGRSGGSKRWPSLIFHPPPRAPPATKWRNDAILRTRWSRRAPERYAPATFLSPADAYDHDGGAATARDHSRAAHADASNRDGGPPDRVGTPRE